ncbi:GSCFA domain-containing protein [Psychroflexus sp. S27]|uniref:GSCFA domain-containing protein n=1 Tax=Psychroflexus sp. S27 TaxID=1982757 RepID=UPI000C29FAAE|nr:GSCFA domain-containing protein [Psychroflexus sp. S27]PJX22853.1 GSCFA domain-containing protein [Psychroflexus sp. S27]
MQLQTEIKLKDGEPKINYGSHLFVLGSCFSEHIGDRLSASQLRVLQNPFGILFHPFSLENFINRVVEQNFFTEKDIFHHNGLWHSFDAHSKMSHQNPDVVLEKLNEAIKSSFEFINKSSHVLITLGTAFIYRHIEKGEYVANCHKIPQKNFDKELISSTQIQQSLWRMIKCLKSINPEINLIFTVSPVRHQKEGFVENNRSKAQLISAIHHIVEKEESSYFPSYEIMMDELRDYRFYKSDMLHPNETAIAYIWEKFTATWMTADTLKIMEKVDKLQRNLKHKAFNPDSEAHQSFLQKVEKQKKELKKRFPHFKFLL